MPRMLVFGFLLFFLLLHLRMMFRFICILLILGPSICFGQSQPFGLPVFPIDNDSCQYTTVQLCANVTDLNGDSLFVQFYFRPSMAAPRDFTLVGLPDTQYYTGLLNGGTNEYFKAQTNWIVSHQDSLNVAHICHLGDCSQNADIYEDEWRRADTAMKTIENPITTQLPDGISYTMNVGNHDQLPFGDPNGTTQYYNQYFGVNRFNGRSYWGGNHGANADNNFQFFSASGYDFIVISLEYDQLNTDTTVLSWADSLLQAHPNRKGIIVSHYLLNFNASFSPQGSTVYNALKTNPNLFLMLCGHVSDEAYRGNVFNGDTVYSILADYQNRSNGGSGWMRLMQFSPEFNTITVKTYSPSLGQYENDADSYFVLPHYLYSQTAYTAIGSAWVDSAGIACITVSGLLANTGYDWYATVTDGNTTTQLYYARFATFGSPVTLAIPQDTVCQFSFPIQLSATPAGGNYTGTGIVGTQFDPVLAGAGMHVINYTYVNAQGCSNTATDSILVEICSGISPVAANAFQFSFQQGKMTFSVSEDCEIHFYDMTGREIKSQQCKAGMNTILLDGIANGVYVFHLWADDGDLGSGKIEVR
jgi:hypothetical protein